MPCVINGKRASLLVDTGASVGMLNQGDRKRLALREGRPYNGTLIGAGGEIEARICDTFVTICGKTVSQFVMADMDGIVRSVERETGVRIVGILSLPQMQFMGMQVDANDSLLIIE